jgi:hypothetical protein
VKRTVQRAVRLRKTMKSSIELAGRRDFQLRPNFQISVRHSNTETLMAVPVCVAALL